MNKNSEHKKIKIDVIINFAKEMGFVYQGSEIYNGLANSWDYGPLGSLLKKNIADFWWNEYITKEENSFGFDSSIFLNTNVWKASGHLGKFSDLFIDCKKCQNRYRVDKLIEDKLKLKVEGKSIDELEKLLKKIKCQKCNSIEYTPIRHFNLMFKTNQNLIEEQIDDLYLRPETAQGIFINFKNIIRTTRAKLPLSVGQIGKAFRNEITPGNFIFRTREFEQMELEHFCHPNDGKQIFDNHVKKAEQFLLAIGLKNEDIKIRKHSKEELSHYSKMTSDIEFHYPFGWNELMGISHRSDYDLKQHMEHSKVDLNYLDPITNKKYLPHVIEPSLGLNRLLLAILCSTYQVEEVNNETRINLTLNYDLAPYKLAILPLTNKQNEESYQLYQELLQENISITYDKVASIGKRYRRQDAIGTPYCIVIDFESTKDNKVTIRNRNTMEQVRKPKKEIIQYINDNKKEFNS